VARIRLSILFRYISGGVGFSGTGEAQWVEKVLLQAPTDGIAQAAECIDVGPVPLSLTKRGVDTKHLAPLLSRNGVGGAEVAELGTVTAADPDAVTAGEVGHVADAVGALAGHDHVRSGDAGNNAEGGRGRLDGDLVTRA
jgi:hypothetical protein